MSEKFTIQTLKNGPFLISGDFVISDESGKKLDCGEKAALCRCGASKTKPFCDGTHKQIGFKD